MADILTYRVSVAPAVDADVVERQLAVYLNGSDVPQEIRRFAAATEDLGEIHVEQDAAVVLTLVDVDDAGNQSEPARLEFVAVDTIPPAQPGTLGVTLVREQPPVDTDNTEPTA